MGVLDFGKYLGFSTNKNSIENCNMTEINKDGGQRIDLTTKQGVLSYLSNAASKDEWNTRCDQVIAQNGGVYPSFFHEVMPIAIGIAHAVWPKADLPGPDAVTPEQALGNFKQIIVTSIEKPPTAPATPQTPKTGK
jgi:hypothetical protein